MKDHALTLSLTLYISGSELVSCLSKNGVKPAIMCVLDGSIPTNIKDFVDIVVDVLKCTLAGVGDSEPDNTTTTPSLEPEESSASASGSGA